MFVVHTKKLKLSSNRLKKLPPIELDDTSYIIPNSILFKGFNMKQEERIQLIDRCKKILGTNDISTIYLNSFPDFHWSTKYRDMVIKQHGLVNEIPVLMNAASHNINTNKYSMGMGIFEVICYNRPDLRYLIVSNQHHSAPDDSFVVAPKGNIWKIVRHCKNLRKLASPDKPPVLQEGLLTEILNGTIRFLLQKKKIMEYGVPVRRGILLDGPPGNGKTMLCRYIRDICVQNNISYANVTASDLEREFADGSLNYLLEGKSFIFFDDIDVDYFDRHRNPRMACAILAALDGMYNDGKPIVRIFTTNETIENIDEAFTRPGRIDRKYSFSKPDRKLRLELIKRWNETIVNNIDLERLLDETDGMSFAQVDSIRTALVSNVVIEGGNWNLDKAIEDVKNHSFESIDYKKPKLGFVETK